MDYVNTNTPSMHPRLGSATLLQLAFPGEGNPIFPWAKSHWGNTVVKSQVENKVLTVKRCCGTLFRTALKKTKNIYNGLTKQKQTKEEENEKGKKKKEKKPGVVLGLNVILHEKEVFPREVSLIRASTVLTATVPNVIINDRNVVTVLISLL